MSHRGEVAGIDVGLSYIKATSGVCRTGDLGFMVGHTFADRTSRLDALGCPGPYSLLAIDGPLMPGLRLDGNARRVCEKVFVLGSFQKRCKPGESHIRGTGQALRRAATETALQFSESVGGETRGHDFPRVAQRKNLIEAFPNAFLGVLVDEQAHELLKPMRRGQKSDLLLEQCRRTGVLRDLRRVLHWSDEAFWCQLDCNNQHDERAALVCALTAVCVWQGAFTAVGDERGGFFFLPPWTVWQVVRIILGKEGEGEARIDEDHSSGSP